MQLKEMDYLKDSAISAIPFSSASIATNTTTFKSNNPPDHHDQNATSSSTATYHAYSPPSKNNSVNCPKRKKLTMAEWIAGAINNGDNHNNGKGSDANALLSSSLSSAYLKCGLKIAHSLADQLCQDQVVGGQGFAGQVVGGQEVVVKKQGEKGNISWSNLVAIYVSSGAAVANSLNGDDEDDGSDTITAGGSSSGKEGEEEENKDNSEKLFNNSYVDIVIEPDPDILGQPPSSNPEELQAMLNSIIPDHSLYLEDDDNGGQDLYNADNNNDSSSVPCHDNDDVSVDHKKAGGLGPKNSRNNKSGSQTGHQTDIQYLDISSAKLEIENDESWHHHKQGDERMRIYLLGRVFIELFSGGMNGDTNTNEHAKLQGDSFSFNSFNLATATNILDALGEDDEIFGSGDVSSDVSSQQTKRLRSSTVEDFPLQLEQLKLSVGLPISLCDLIVNMIHCSQGDFSKDETYSTMADVKKDLKYMLEYPDIYLYDLDLKDACASGLHMDDDGMLGRDAEFASLKELYLSSSVPNGCGCAIVSGTDGVGKTTLQNKVINYAKSSSRDERERKDCVILTGKFDKVSQSQPYSAVSSAFNEYCDWLSRAENASASEKVSLALKQDLSPVYVRTIAKLVPSLFKITGDYVDGLDDTDGFDGSEKRLRFLLCRFLHIIRRAHDSTLILWLDDLQWADKSSIALINQVIMAFDSSDDDRGFFGFFFLGGCRETESDHALWKMISCVAEFGIHTTKIELGGIDQEAANLLVSTKLKLLPRLTLPLAAILHHRCKGNPMFLEQFMVELCKEGLLRPSLALRRWVWDEEKIFERQLPDDLVEFITKSLNRLQKEVISSLCILSCFGTSTDCSLVEKLQNAAGLSLLDPLDTAVAQGILNKKNKVYFFVHDRVMEAVYNMMEPEERRQYHYKYGMYLCTVAMTDKDDGLLLIAVGQINLSGSMALHDEDAERGLKAAKLNQLAGKIAMGMSDLFSAYSFFDHGISALRKGHWANHYQLSLELYNGAVFCALENGDEHATLDILADQIVHYARCSADKMHVMYIIQISLHHQGKFLSAIEHGLDVLSQLGEVFPTEFTPDAVSQSYENTKAMLQHLSDEDLLNYKRVHDPMKETAIKFLTKLSQTMYVCRPSDQPIITMRIIEISLVHGFSSMSHLGFAFYGGFVGRLGDIRGGYRFAKLSNALFNKTDAAQSSAEGLAYTTQIIAHIEPIQSVVDLSTHDCKVIMAEGSAHDVLLNSFLRCLLYFWSGAKLSRVLESFEENLRMVIQYKHMTFLAMMIPTRRTVLTLHGTSVEQLSNPANHLNVDSNKLDNKANLVQSHSFRFNQMIIAFMFRRYDETKSFAIKYSEFNIGFWMILFHQTMNSFYDGLVSYWIGREENSPKWIRKGANCKLVIEKLAESSQWNFQNKLHLLSAEEQFCERNFEVAERYYDSAVSSAKDHKFLNEEALANEMAGYFYLETGRRGKSIQYFSEAINCYQQWEAHAKVKSLQTYLEEVIVMASS